MISASGEVGVRVMVGLCQRVLDGKGIPDESQASVLVPISKKREMLEIAILTEE